MSNDFTNELNIFADQQKILLKHDPAEYERRMKHMKTQAERMLKNAQGTDKRMYQITANAVLQLLEHENPEYLRALTQMNKMPVTIDEFIESPEFLGNLIDIWPTIRQDARAMNPDVFLGQEAVTEAYLAGATNTAKTTLGIVTNLYQTYLTTCFDRPQRLFRLSDVTPLVLFFTSTSPRNADNTIYRPFRNLFLGMPYVQKWVEYDKYKEAKLVLGNGLEVFSSAATVEAMVGQAIMGGIIDEVNFLSVVQQSKQVVDSSGNGGLFDQAEIAYNTLSRRRASRFHTTGISLGCISVSSSVRYLGDFLDRRINQCVANREPNRFWSRRKTYEVLTPEKYAKERFKLLIGGRTHSTRILDDDDVEGIDYPAGAQTELVPVNYKVQFEADPENALRDVCGIATNSIAPFITKREKLLEAFDRSNALGMEQYINKQICNVHKDGMPLVYADKLPFDRESGRFVHVDLAFAKDRCGIAVVRVNGVKRVQTDAGVYEDLPNFEVEMIVAIEPHSTKEIDIAEVRQWILNLEQIYGIPIAKVSYDGFNSKESIQVLNKAGIKSELISVDRTIEPYEYFRRAIYQDRVAIIPHELALTELGNVEYLVTKGKVDHPKNLSKDAADAIVGAIYSASKSRWGRKIIGTGVKDEPETNRPNRRNPTRRRTIERR